MKIYPSSKVVFLIHPHPQQFLNGLTSNVLDQPRNVFLNIHGRIIAIFDQVRKGVDEFLIVLEPTFVDQVLAHLDRYARLSGVKVEKTTHRVYFDLEGDYKPQGEEFVIPQKRGQLIITQRILESNVTDEEFLYFRVENEIPLHGVDYQDEFILNVSETEFVSFTKGCFLGQEPVSKVHNRSKPSWELMIKYEDQCGDEEKQKMTSKIQEKGTGRVKGFVFVRNE
ncbi:MAG: hypothetical protein NUV91_03505 [Candidatus Omnitrophica bacterium]|nr:hypothetical protein [Candidatus Omnitrophota bacterium]